jgi:3-oxoacyl-[acyl-carrier-protein] synthase II
MMKTWPMAIAVSSDARARFVLLALKGAREALAHAGLTPSAWPDPTRVAV